MGGRDAAEGRRREGEDALKLMVFPEARQEEVAAVVRAELGGHGAAPDDLTLVIVRLAAQQGWSVTASGLGDPLLEQGYCDVVQRALRRAGL